MKRLFVIVGLSVAVGSIVSASRTDDASSSSWNVAGAAGYLGFNRESQLSILIRTALCSSDAVHFQVGAGIVADSNPEAEYQETLDKAAGFLRLFDGSSSTQETPAELPARGRIDPERTNAL